MKPPAFQFYAAEYLADEHVQLMTLEEEGAYIRLLSFCWREGSIPSDISALSRLCKGASTTVLAEVVKRFKPNSNEGRLVHPRLEAERIKQSQWREKSAQGGRASAHKRRHPKSVAAQQGGVTKPQPERLKQEATLQSSTSVSTTSSEEKKEVRAAKPPDPRAHHPAIEAVWKTRGRYPLRDLWDLVIETVGENPDLERMKKCWLKWRGKGFSPENYGWLTDWYVNGEERNNGTHKPRYESSTERDLRNLRGSAEYIRSLSDSDSEADSEDPIGLLASNLRN